MDMAPKTLCIFHGGCDDGFGAAYAVWRALGEAVEFHAGAYGAPPPDVTGRHVLLVDFSYKRPVLEVLARQARTITILDHHKTARDDLGPFIGSEIEMGMEPEKFGALARFTAQLPVRAEFDMNRCGSMMAWEYFHGKGTAPLFFDYLQDRDLWLKQKPDGDQFTMALRSYPQSFDAWDPIIRAEGGVAQLIEEGEHIVRYYRAILKGMTARAFRRDIQGHNVPVCNAPYEFASDLAGELAAGEPFAACFFDTRHGTQFSLRSRPGGVDVSEIAKQFGGGGHAHAAGFQIRSGDHLGELWSDTGRSEA